MADDHAGAEIIVLDVPTTLDISPERVLKGAEGKLDSVLLVGYTPEGELYIASSMSDRAEMNWLADKLKMELLCAPRGD
jgi:hypothetical protein